MPLNDGSTPDQSGQKKPNRAGPAKRARRNMKKALATSREAVVSRVPAGVRKRFGPAANHFRMLVSDHLFLRYAFRNRHLLAPGVWRSAQPLPHQIRALANEGIRTIVNLRGKTKTATYELEKSTCELCGITLIDLPLKSRAAPSKEVLSQIRRLLHDVEKPVLLHCKSGADRAGFISVLYLHEIERQPITEAMKQLSLKYGHIRQADTGVLDAFFERYLADTAASPIAFWTWVEEMYDPADLDRSFKGKSWATRIVRNVLRRE